MRTLLSRPMRLLDAIQDQPTALFVSDEPPLASDEELLKQVERLLQDQGLPLDRSLIVAAAHRLDEADSQPPDHGPPEVVVTASTSFKEKVSPWTQWKVNAWLALSRWFFLRAQHLVPHTHLAEDDRLDEGALSWQERRQLQTLQKTSRIMSPVISTDQDHEWAMLFWKIRQKRYGWRWQGEELSCEEKKLLRACAPIGHDPLITPHFRDNAFSDRERTAFADLLYKSFDHPERKPEIDWDLLKFLVACGLSPDVDQGRVWLSINHPKQTGWTVRQSCVYLHLTDALEAFSPIVAPVPTKETQSLLWWAGEAHYVIDYSTYWGYLACEPTEWGNRFKTTVLWILDHEQGAKFHARLLRKMVARNHPLSHWILDEMERRRWPAR